MRQSDLTAAQKRKHKLGLCITPYCRGNRRGEHYTCYKCIKKRYKEKNPVRYTFSVLKNNAKRRGKYFDLTFNQFKRFIEKTDYMKYKGKNAESLSIDCINPELGYTYSNIRAITVSLNSSKGNKFISDDIPF